MEAGMSMVRWLSARDTERLRPTRTRFRSEPENVCCCSTVT